MIESIKFRATSRIIADYIHEDDYDPSDVEWIDITSDGSQFIIEMDRCNPYHQRLRKIGTYDPWMKVSE